MIKKDERGGSLFHLRWLQNGEVASAEKIDAMGSDLGLEQELVMYV